MALVVLLYAKVAFGFYLFISHSAWLSMKCDLHFSRLSVVTSRAFDDPTRDVCAPITRRREMLPVSTTITNRAVSYWSRTFATAICLTTRDCVNERQIAHTLLLHSTRNPRNPPGLPHIPPNSQNSMGTLRSPPMGVDDN